MSGIHNNPLIDRFGRVEVAFEECGPFDHVGLSSRGAVKLLLQRAAVLAGKSMTYRVTASNFEAALRVVAAQWAISIMPQDSASIAGVRYPVKVVPLADEWMTRQFVVCFKDPSTLSPAAELLIAHLSAVSS